MSSYSSSYDWVKLDCWSTFVSTPGVKLDSRGLAAEMPKLFNVSSQLVLLQCLMWCLNDFCVVNLRLQLGHCFLDWVDIIWISYTILDKLFIHWIHDEFKFRGEVDCDKKQWWFLFTRYHTQNNRWIHTRRILENFGKKYLTQNYFVKLPTTLEWKELNQTQ